MKWRIIGHAEKLVGFAESIVMFLFFAGWGIVGLILLFISDSSRATFLAGFLIGITTTLLGLMILGKEDEWE